MITLTSEHTRQKRHGIIQQAKLLHKLLSANPFHGPYWQTAHCNHERKSGMGSTMNSLSTTKHSNFQQVKSMSGPQKDPFLMRPNTLEAYFFLLCLFLERVGTISSKVALWVKWAAYLFDSNKTHCMLPGCHIQDKTNPLFLYL